MDNTRGFEGLEVPIWGGGGGVCVEVLIWF
jgi:hypothetical protein